MKPTKFPRLVGLVASAPGAGKDTCFAHLKDLTGLPLENIKFAGKLEEEVYTLFPRLQRQDLEFFRNEPRTKDRPLYILSGTELTHKGGYRNWLRKQGHDMGAPRSIRWHLIQYGTNFVRRHLGKDSHWLDAGMAAARLAHTTDRPAIITDVRFPNEAKAVKDAGGLLVFIDTPWNTNTNGGEADGLIPKSECHIILTNKKGFPDSTALQFIDLILKGPYNE